MPTGFPTSLNAAHATGYLVTAADWNDLVAKSNSVAMWPLQVASGTSTAAGATNVSTFAMASGLTALDRLIVMIHAESVTQATAGVQLYNSTDSVQIASLTASLGAGATMVGDVHVGQYQSSAVKIGSHAKMSTGILNTDATFATAWTGAWTLALRHTGVTAGGTFRYNWGIYLLKGQ